ncbi:hypothetical protein JCM10213_002688 [Rhodosporidiobolus nylandii]
MQTPPPTAFALPPTPTSNPQTVGEAASSLNLYRTSPTASNASPEAVASGHAPLLLDVRCLRLVETATGTAATVNYSLDEGNVLWSSVDKSRVEHLRVEGEHDLVDLVSEVLPKLRSLTFTRASIDVGGATQLAVSRAFPLLRTLVVENTFDDSARPATGLICAFTGCDIEQLAVFFDEERVALRPGWFPATFSGDDHELLLIGLRTLAVAPVTGVLNVDAMADLEGLVIPSTTFVHNILFDDTIHFPRYGQPQGLYNLVRLRLLPVRGDIARGPELRLQARWRFHEAVKEVYLDMTAGRRQERRSEMPTLSDTDEDSSASENEGEPVEDRHNRYTVVTNA